MTAVSFLRLFDPETAHRLALLALKSGFVPRASFSHPSLQTMLWGKMFDNPLGLAAGFDKGAEVLRPMLDTGFGFVEAGTVTRYPQAGNPRPRVFRDEKNKSVINRMGFPGAGVEPFRANVEKFRRDHAGIVGINIGINKDSQSLIEDYCYCAHMLAPMADYIAVNISSPNTLGLRDLHAADKLDDLLKSVMAECGKTPLLVKISPDLSPVQHADVVSVAASRGVSGLIVSNTTTARPDILSSKLRTEAGGLSGALLKDRATQMIAATYNLTGGKIPIIGVGGVSNAQDAYEKIRAGASLVQLYTALVYEGPAVVTRILEGLAQLLARDGFSNIADAVGSGQKNLRQVS